MTDPEPLSLAFSALADRTRRKILERLAHGPASVGDLAAPFEMSAPAVSRHLKVLERARLISRTANAQWRTIALRTEALDEVTEWIDAQRREWDQRFDALDTHLEKMKTTTRTTGSQEQES
ncbi:metalloregulator ArsR/SmtB family transcription factor [Corynebacterium sp.]|uniref:ArsR/SmtB family transcription factor n=1 Tax=Corynebacterium sp. TaxID=1720 RepID=UPI0028AC5DAD|nr:metalloregulator ArsR/SmtB family transcription factor [Corynebacterium sp.]